MRGRAGGAVGVAALLMLMLACHEPSTRHVPEDEHEGDHVFSQDGTPPQKAMQNPFAPQIRETCPPYCPPSALGMLGRQPGANPVPAENAKPGTPDWKTGRQANHGELEVYTSTEAVFAGETVQVRVSTDAPQTVTAEIYRVGHYQGAGARKVWTGGPFPVSKQSPCPRDPATGRIECAWTDTFSVPVAADWVSGVYLVKVIRADGFKRFAPWVVHDRRAAEFLYQPAFNTYQAYNNWGGTSLYGDSWGTMPKGHGYQVSFDRPYRDDDGAGQLFHWELPLIQALEQNGYDVSYGTNLDFSRFHDVLVGIGAFVQAGHDEYWSAEERSQVDEALAGGQSSLVHFGGNGAYWRVRMLSNASGNELRTLACYKGLDGDPQPGSTVRFRDGPDPKPESALYGGMYESWQLIPFPLTVSNPSHWIYAGTNLKSGDLLQGLVGNEYDRVPDGVAPAGLTVSAEGPVVSAEGVPSHAQVVDRILPSGRLVFSAGSIYWANAFSTDPAVRDGRVMRMTFNVLERAVSHRRVPRILPAVIGPVPPQAVPESRWAKKVEAVAGQVLSRGPDDGPGAAARFQEPTGLAETGFGQLLVADTGGNRIRLIENDGLNTVRTIAGDGPLGLKEGPGSVAQFRRPTAIAIGPDGAAYIADSDNHNIRRLELVPPYNVTTWAGGLREQGTAEGLRDQARFRRPTALAFDSQGNLFVADQANNRIRRIDGASSQVTTYAGSGDTGSSDDAVGVRATFNNPSGIGVAAGGEVYVFDAGNGLIRRIGTDPAHSVVTLAGQPHEFGFADGPGTDARFRGQMGFVVSPYGELILADTANYRIRKIIPGADASTTHVYTLAGTGRQGSALGTGDVADLVAPAGVVYGSDGRIYVSDSYNQVIRAITR